jgi:hypothetical protein
LPGSCQLNLLWEQMGRAGRRWSPRLRRAGATSSTGAGTFHCSRVAVVGSTVLTRC